MAKVKKTAKKKTSAPKAKKTSVKKPVKKAAPAKKAKPAAKKSAAKKPVTSVRSKSKSTLKPIKKMSIDKNKKTPNKTETIDSKSLNQNPPPSKVITSSKEFLNNPVIPQKPSYKPTPQPPPPSTNPDEKTRYTDEELQEFHVLITDKLERAKKELNYIKEVLSKRNDSGTDTTAGTFNLLEDGSDTAEKENFTQLAARQQKFVQQLEAAIARIKNGTYGICVDSGKLISKERLRAVPHTQHSIEAKLNRKD